MSMQIFCEAKSKFNNLATSLSWARHSLFLWRETNFREQQAIVFYCSSNNFQLGWRTQLVLKTLINILLFEILGTSHMSGKDPIGINRVTGGVIKVEYSQLSSQGYFTQACLWQNQHSPPSPKRQHKHISTQLYFFICPIFNDHTLFHQTPCWLMVTYLRSWG